MTKARHLTKFGFSGLLVLAMVAAFGFAWNAFNRIGNLLDPPMALYDARIIDLSKVDLAKNSVVPFDARVKWATQPRAGVALWDPKEESYLVFPLAEGDDPFAPNMLRLDAGQLPKTSPGLLSAFEAGMHIHCDTSRVSFIDITMSDRSRTVGSVQVVYSGQGQPIDYSSTDRFLF